MKKRKHKFKKPQCYGAYPATVFTEAPCPYAPGEKVHIEAAGISGTFTVRKAKGYSFVLKDEG